MCMKRGHLHCMVMCRNWLEHAGYHEILFAFGLDSVIMGGHTGEEEKKRKEKKSLKTPGML